MDIPSKDLLDIGRVKGFSQRTFDAVDQTPFLPEVPNLDLWRSPVTQGLVKSDLSEFKLRSSITRKANKTVYLITEAFGKANVKVIVALYRVSQNSRHSRE